MGPASDQVLVILVSVCNCSAYLCSSPFKGGWLKGRSSTSANACQQYFSRILTDTKTGRRTFSSAPPVTPGRGPAVEAWWLAGSLRVRHPPLLAGVWGVWGVWGTHWGVGVKTTFTYTCTKPLAIEICSLIPTSKSG